MAWLIGDSFDFYSGNAASLAGLWDSVATYSGWNINSTTRFGVGRSLSIGNCSTILTKAFGSNEATIFLAVAHRRDGALGGRSTGTPICSCGLFGSGPLRGHRAILRVQPRP
jgi:hypothetical protein